MSDHDVPTGADESDPFVPVWEGPFVQAQEKLRLIEAAHIPVDLGDALEVGHARVEVPRSYVADARDAMQGDAAPWPDVMSSYSDVELRPGQALRTVGLYVLVFVVIAVLVLTMVL